jgi:GNAT superfamily N-acetyltransferase
MISIQKIALDELEEFYSSSDFRELKNKPISFARVQSYLNNPRANKNDIVLYLAFYKKELIGYRSIWGDAFYTGDKKVSFGWLSGSWVHPKHRRKGVSTLLFKEVAVDWQHKLMYTNYAENSKLLYDKTNQFSLLHRLEGVRYYIRFSFADILPKKKKIFKTTKIIWSVLDYVFNIVINSILRFKKTPKTNDFYIKKNEPWNDSIIAFIDTFINKNLFQRQTKEFDWIQKYAWVFSNDRAKIESKSYYFSCYSKPFESDIYSIYSKENALIGFILMTVSAGHMKIPYAYFHEQNSKEISDFISEKCALMNVKTVVLYNKVLELELNNTLFFVSKKVFIQNYFIAKKIEENFKIKQPIQIQTGDGDVVFT